MPWWHNVAMPTGDTNLMPWRWLLTWADHYKGNRCHMSRPFPGLNAIWFRLSWEMGISAGGKIGHLGPWNLEPWTLRSGDVVQYSNICQLHPDSFEQYSIAADNASLYEILSFFFYCLFRWKQEEGTQYWMVLMALILGVENASPLSVSNLPISLSPYLCLSHSISYYTYMYLISLSHTHTPLPYSSNGYDTIMEKGF